MLTAAQKAQCTELAQALDRGDLSLWRKAEASLGPEARGLIWDLRQHVVATGQRPQAAAMRPQQTELLSVDLDFWADDPAQPIDDDVPDDEPVCSACKGTGKGRDGNKCKICGGRGRIPAEDQPNHAAADDDDDDTEQQQTKLCPVCRGKGRDHSGDTCEECGGSGRVPIDEDEEDE